MIWTEARVWYRRVGLCLAALVLYSKNFHRHRHGIVSETNRRKDEMRKKNKNNKTSKQKLVEEQLFCFNHFWARTSTYVEWWCCVFFFYYFHFFTTVIPKRELTWNGANRCEWKITETNATVTAIFSFSFHFSFLFFRLGFFILGNRVGWVSLL